MNITIEELRKVGTFLSAEITANFEYNRYGSEYYEQQTEIKKWFENNIDIFFKEKFENNGSFFFFMYKDQPINGHVVFHVAVFTTEEELQKVLDEILKMDTIESTNISIYDPSIVNMQEEGVEEEDLSEELKILID
ncbi:MAG: hypothetical protein ISR98_00535 [Parcubacteria group bacterium]|nr:hypothetical protein [Parcubacteria group bacterium]